MQKQNVIRRPVTHTHTHTHTHTQQCPAQRWWCSILYKNSRGIGTLNIQLAIDVLSTTDFGLHVEVASLEVIEEMMAEVSPPQAGSI